MAESNGKNGASAEPPRFDEDAFKKSVQTVPRGQQAFSPTDNFVVFLAQTVDEVEPWGRNVKMRDQQLREFAANEPIFASALATVCARNAAMQWKIEGPDKQADESQRILQQANFGAGWQDFSLKLSRDLYTQDNGAFVEIIREANRADAPVMGIANLDSARCYHTGHPDVPVLYVDRDNKYHYLAWYQVVTIAEMPSASEGLRGLQYCAVTRLFRSIKTQRDIGIYLSEKIGGRNPRAVHLLRGVGADEVLAAWQKVGFQNDSAGLTRFSNPVMVSAIAPDVEVDVKTLEIASVPDMFDMAEHWKQYIAQIAMAFLSDYQEFAPLPGGGLGTASQSETQHKKSSRTGIALYRGAIEHSLNWGVFPDDVEMSFEEPDLDAEQSEALARKTRAEERKVRIESQEITAAIARMRALSSDDLTQEEYDEAEKQAEEQAKQQEEAEAAMQEQQAAQLEALNNGQNPPPGQNSAKPPRSLGGVGKPKGQSPPAQRAPVGTGQAGKAIGVSRSRTQVESKVEEAVTAAFDDLWASVASRVGFEVEDEDGEVTEKFSESDWERNSGRFANFVGSRGGGGGGSGGEDVPSIEDDGAPLPPPPPKYDPIIGWDETTPILGPEPPDEHGHSAEDFDRLLSMRADLIMEQAEIRMRESAEVGRWQESEGGEPHPPLGGTRNAQERLRRLDRRHPEVANYVKWYQAGHPRSTLPVDRRKSLDTFEEVAQKWAESDWVRNAGRFADFIGRGGGGRAGGAGAAKEESGVDTIGGTRVDLSKISDPEIRGRAMSAVRKNLDDVPELKGYVKEVRAETLGPFEAGKHDGVLAIRLDPSSFTPDGLERLRKQADNGELSEAWRFDPVQAAVSHEFGHAVEDRLIDEWRDDPVRNLDAYMAIDRTRSRKGNGRLSEESVFEHFAESFAERQTLPKTGWSPGARAVDEVVSTANARDWWGSR